MPGWIQVRQVHDVVAELRTTGLVDLGDAQRTRLPVGETLAGVRVDDLDHKGVLEHVQPIVGRALDGHRLHLVEAIGGKVLHTKPFLEEVPLTHVGDGPQCEVRAGVVPHLFGSLGETQQVITRRQHSCHAVPSDELDLLPARGHIPCRCREDDAVQPVVRAFVKGESAVVQPVGP